MLLRASVYWETCSEQRCILKLTGPLGQVRGGTGRFCTCRLGSSCRSTPGRLRDNVSTAMCPCCLRSSPYWRALPHNLCQTDTSKAACALCTRQVGLAQQVCRRWHPSHGNIPATPPINMQSSLMRDSQIIPRAALRCYRLPFSCSTASPPPGQPACEIRAHDELYREHAAAPHDGDVRVRDCQQRVGHDVLRVVHPPRARLVQHLPLLACKHLLNTWQCPWPCTLAHT